jgi:ATP-dependent DNA helicase RecQ
LNAGRDFTYHRTMPDAATLPESLDQRVAVAVKRTWGYDALRPMQAEAIQAGVDRRDSLVVLPTGGGKSLCYQVPPLVAERTDIVVSPLISLMKDQVDGLRECGYPAAALHSGMSRDEQQTVEDFIVSGNCRLVLVSPERVLTPRFIGLMQRARVSTFAIDEAHCISQWGHDFRPEYRRLGGLKERFAEIRVHAYTATATERVRRDIVELLGLTDPLLLVGTFDRPNLTYRVVPRIDLREQVLGALRRHRNQAAIVYCISRKETEALAEFLRSQKIRAEAYHAGLSPDQRRRTQDAFSQEKLDVVVATVAFGMGIDRSDVRCVIHAAMPKSIEHYQQETGRAGRDGLPAECVLLHSTADLMRWESLLERSRDEALANVEIQNAEVGNGEDVNIPRAAILEAHTATIELMSHMRKYCVALTCRHQALSAYFGQTLAAGSCGACDVCLGEVEGLEEATVTAQKILSCIARVEERFGVQHVADVLLGSESERVKQFGHNRLSTYGLLRTSSKKVVANQIHQLLDQDLLTRARVNGDMQVLKLNAASWEIMRGKRTVFLSRVRTPKAVKTEAEAKSWEGVDEALFDDLRALRRELATERNVPPYLIFSDKTLREIARVRPRTRVELRQVPGVGDRKLEDLGYAILSRMESFLARADS